MEDSVEQANALIQRKLVLVKDSALAHKTIECTFNVTDDLSVLHNISHSDAPMWKSTTIVQIVRKRKVQRQDMIVFPKNYLVKQSQCTENRFQMSTTQAKWVSLSRNAVRLQRMI
ncbi:hypothetical protein Pcac1_g14744 [Phytophthora cactorum]|nr:hypothetical protein Pcac1_g14744 [Phytophthora cactorum]